MNEKYNAEHVFSITRASYKPPLLHILLRDKKQLKLNHLLLTEKSKSELESLARAIPNTIEQLEINDLTTDKLDTFVKALRVPVKQFFFSFAQSIHPKTMANTINLLPEMTESFTLASEIQFPNDMDFIQALSPLAKKNQLREITLNHIISAHSNKAIAHFFSLLSTQRSLKKLTLACDSFFIKATYEPESIPGFKEVFAALPKSLDTLHLEQFNLGGVSDGSIFTQNKEKTTYSILSGLTNLPLNHLSLAQNDLGFMKKPLEILPLLPNTLMSLDLSYNNLDRLEKSTLIKFLSTISIYLPHLEELTIDLQTIKAFSDDEIKICAQQLRQVKKINFVNRITGTIDYKTNSDYAKNQLPPDIESKATLFKENLCVNLREVNQLLTAPTVNIPSELSKLIMEYKTGSTPRQLNHVLSEHTDNAVKGFTQTHAAEKTSESPDEEVSRLVHTYHNEVYFSGGSSYLNKTYCLPKGIQQALLTAQQEEEDPKNFKKRFIQEVAQYANNHNSFWSRYRRTAATQTYYDYAVKADRDLNFEKLMPELCKK